MKNSKKIISCLLTLILICGMFTLCAGAAKFRRPVIVGEDEALTIAPPTTTEPATTAPADSTNTAKPKFRMADNIDDGLERDFTPVEDDMYAHYDEFLEYLNSQTNPDEEIKEGPCGVGDLLALFIYWYNHIFKK